VNDFVYLFLTIVVFLLRYTYKALLAKMCRIGDFKGAGHSLRGENFRLKGCFALKSMDR